jgi:hypothetical protein
VIAFLQSIAPGKVDTKAKDVSRLWFASWRRSKHHDVARLDGDWIDAAALAKQLNARKAPRPLAPVVEIPSSVLSRARKYVECMDPAISGSNGHQALWRVALACVRGFNLPLDQARVLLREYSSRCSPPWSEKELDHKLKSAAASNMPGGYFLASSPGRGSSFDRAAQDAWDALTAEERYLAEERAAITGREPRKLLRPMSAAVPILWAPRTPIATGIEAIDAQCDGGIDPGSIVTIVAAPGAGKTLFAAQLAAHAQASPTLDGAIYIAADEGIGGIAARVVQNVGAASYPEIRYRHEPARQRATEAMGALRMEFFEGSRVAIEDLLQDAGAGKWLFVFDMIQRVNARREETYPGAAVSDHKAIEARMSVIHDWTLSTGGIAIVLSEMGRGSYQAESTFGASMGAAKGSGSIESYSSLHMIFRRLNEQGDAEVTVEKKRFAPALPPKGFSLAIDRQRARFNGVDDGHVIERSDRKVGGRPSLPDGAWRDRVLAAVREHAGEFTSVRQLTDSLGGNASKTRNAVRELLDSGELVWVANALRPAPVVS